MLVLQSSGGVVAVAVDSVQAVGVYESCAPTVFERMIVLS